MCMAAPDKKNSIIIMGHGSHVPKSLQSTQCCTGPNYNIHNTECETQVDITAQKKLQRKRENKNEGIIRKRKAKLQINSIFKHYWHDNTKKIYTIGKWHVANIGMWISDTLHSLV